MAICMQGCGANKESGCSAAAEILVSYCVDEDMPTLVCAGYNLKVLFSNVVGQENIVKG